MRNKKYTCFVISPIGEPGTQTRTDADDLLELVIEPAMKEFGFSVIRGDHSHEANRIDEEVIKWVQDADLCICNLSEMNVNVYYELGRRDETGKPVFLLKSVNTPKLPVDIGTRRCIEYDLDNRHGARDAINQLQSFVRPLLENAFSSSTKAASLSEIADGLQRLERKIDRAISSIRTSENIIAPVDIDENSEDPVDTFQLALRQRNLQMAEHAMAMLKYRMEKIRYLDLVVEQVAAMGSHIAGNILIESAQEFFDSDVSDIKKSEYLGCLVSYALKCDREADVRDDVESMARHILNLPDASPDAMKQAHNQLNRLYYGIYSSTHEEVWLQMALAELDKAIAISPEAFLYFNKAVCFKNLNDYESAAVAVEKCMEISETEQHWDPDHVELACEMYHKTGNSKLSDAFELLKKLSPVKAQLFARNMR